jgi:carbon storage regulator
MLVLARKPNQSIMIGDNIEIRIVDVRGDQVKIGISAPKNIKVHRKEIYEEIKKANKEAMSSNIKSVSNMGLLKIKKEETKK